MRIIVTARDVRVTTVAVEKHKYCLFWMCIRSLSYPPYKRCILLPSVACSALQYLSTLSHKRQILWQKKLLNIKCVLTFSTSFVRNISDSKTNSARYFNACTYVFVQNTRYSCQIVLKLILSHQIFSNYSYQISWKFVQREQSSSMRTDWRTDRYDEANSRCSQFFQSV